MIIKSLCKTLVVSSIILGSCGEEKKSAPSAETTPTSESADSSDASSKEIERLKAKIAELSSNSAEPIDDNDGWLLVGEPQITKELFVHLNFDDDDYGKRVELTLSECGDVKLLGGSTAISAISSTVTGIVGAPIGIRFYHSNGEVTAPSGICKLTATVIGASNGEGDKEESKKLTIKAGNVKLSKAKYSDGSTRPFFDTNDEGRVTISIANKGFTTGDMLFFLYKQENTYFSFFGTALDEIGADNTITAEVCKEFNIPRRQNNESTCSNNQWLTRIPAEGNYLLFAVGYDSSTERRVGNVSAILETGELEE